MENALAVANYFIGKSLATGFPVTNMKLVKLVYISHGWHLGLTGDPLISEAAEAWKYGPVVASVYHSLKEYGSRPISSFITTTNQFGQSVVYSLSNPGLSSFLDRIWDLYGHYDGVQLSAMTHRDDTPWQETWNRAGSQQLSVPIPNELIAEHYVQILSHGKQAAQA